MFGIDWPTTETSDRPRAVAGVGTSSAKWGSIEEMKSEGFRAVDSRKKWSHRDMVCTPRP